MRPATRTDDAARREPPLFSAQVEAGFPSPTDDYAESSLDLNEHLVPHPAATFFVRVSGHSMTGAGIHHGDLLIVDRSLEARDGCVVVAVLDGGLTVKRLRVRDGRARLVAERSDHPPIVLDDEGEGVVWGVASHVVHDL